MDIAISLVAGLGLFLYGMNLLGEGLSKAAGNNIKKIIELLTNNTLIGILVGIIITVLIQSSSATTVMVVGFVNAGMMSLIQATGIIMGANVGTTITTQLVSFNLQGVATISLGFGVILFLFSKKQDLKYFGEILLGFGILFIGMKFMIDAVSPLAQLPEFRDAMLYFSSHPILGVLFGFVITGIVQSSSASMGMSIALASAGLLPLSSALPILYGDNIGTCVTSLISSIGTSRNAKRAAIIHLCFNIIGTILFIVLLNKPITYIVTSINPLNSARQIANAHTLFNFINVIILLPSSRYLVKLSFILIPFRSSEDDDEYSTKYLDERILETPSIALANTIKEVLHMGNKTIISLDASIVSFINKSKKDTDITFKYEKLINNLQRDILNYLLKLSKAPLNDCERYKTDLLFNIVNDIERVADHAENIAELSDYLIDNNVIISDVAIEELNNIYNKVLSNFKNALNALDKDDKDTAYKILLVEKEVDLLEKSYRSTHLDRLNRGNCTIDAGILYLDILTNLERISNHAVNIALQILRIN